jgi:dTDP-4-amino-4,6-dideoxygalactose transaminase
MVRSGRNVRLIDAAAEGFGMDLPALMTATQHRDFSLVLSEPYGHAYKLDELASLMAARPKLRIVDSAMAVAHQSLFARLQGNDFALVSFAAGKSMSTGWGGMGFTRDASLAAEVLRQRDTWLARGDAKLALKRAFKILACAVLHDPRVYAVAQPLWKRAQPLRSWLRRRQTQAETTAPSTEVAATSFPPEWSDDSSCAAEWRLPSTYSDRRLALRNLEAAGVSHAARLEQAARYARNLDGIEGLRLPHLLGDALSHYTVRVHSQDRRRVRDELRRRGVPTLWLWPFYPHLDPDRHPNAFRLSCEVISLPLSPRLTALQVDRVCAALRDALAIH